MNFTTELEALNFIADQVLRLRADRRGFSTDLVDGTDATKVATLLDEQAATVRAENDDRTIDDVLVEAAAQKQRAKDKATQKRAEKEAKGNG